jgi:hypothetical protein
MDSLKHVLNLFRGRTRLAACVVLLQEGNAMSVDVCIIVKKGSSLVVEQKATGLSLEKLKIVVGNIPVIISLAGESIIHKKIEKAKDQHWLTVVPQVIPKFRAQDFFIQYTPLADDSSYLSVIRKHIVDNIVTQFAADGFVLCDMILGPFVLHTVTGLMEDASAITTSHYEIQVSAHKIRHLKLATSLNSSLINLGQSIIESDILVQYAHGINFWSKANIGVEYSPVNPVEISRRKFEEANKLTLVVLTGLLLVTLFFIGSSIGLAIVTTRLSSIQLIFGAQVKKNSPAKDVVTEFSTVRETVEALGIANRHHVSRYGDRIAWTKPKEIVLTNLNLFPVITVVRQPVAPKFNSKIIEISGECVSNEELARWIGQLSAEPWVASVQNQVYHRSDQRKSASFSFQINLPKQ